MVAMYKLSQLAGHLPFVCALTLALVGHAAIAAEPTARRPNILFILADDQRWDTIGELGNREIRTPNLDRLVERGFHFNNAYCMGGMTPAVCLPSRTMIITGRSLWHIPENPRAKIAPPGVPLLPTLVAEAGYATFHCGKIGNSCTFGNAAFGTNLETNGRTAESATEHADKVLEFLGAGRQAAVFCLPGAAGAARPAVGAGRVHEAL